ncbi:hypothetical protein PG985_000857 [Apiospora marii]|uniref:uncharacterized protein n=1 Tax=Apiospora marii TaxID=335849 RepID=UPI00312F0640
MDESTIEWFGTTTFRLRTRGVTIFLDTWLDKPDVMPGYLAVDDVTEADYISISHAHFDHLPGADRGVAAGGEADAGRANLNGRPFDGSAAEFASRQVEWLGKPSQVIWCLHDETCIPPWRIDTSAATATVEGNGKSKVLNLKHVDVVSLDI